MDWINELRDIAPPRLEVAAAPTVQDWTAAQAALNACLPEDYKRFMKTWGPSFIGRFMFAFSPAGEQPGGELVRNAEYVSGALSQLKAHHSHRITAPVFPEPGGFLSMGRTHNGDFIGWMTTGGQPENWPVAVWGDEDDSPQVFEGMAFGEFILGVVSGTLRPEAFPDDVWKPVPVTVEPIPPQNRS